MQSDQTSWVQLSLPAHLAESLAPLLRAAGVEPTLEAGQQQLLELGDGDRVVEPEWKLRRCLEWALETREVSNQSRNIEAYRASLRRWEKLTANPPICQINRQVLQEFADALLRLPGRIEATMANNTVLKHLNAVYVILKLANKNRGAPPPRRPKELPASEDPDVRTIPLENLQLIYHATAAARYPRLPYCTPVGWWCALIMYLYSTGARIENARGVRWSNINLDTGEIQAPRAIMKKRRRKTLCLSEQAIAHLRYIQPEPNWTQSVSLGKTRNQERARKALTAAEDLVFPWLDCFGTRRHGVRALGKSLLYDEWHLIQETAGIVPEPPKGYYGFHDIRRTVGTSVFDNLSEAAAIELLGHKQSKTFRKSYLGNRTSRIRAAVQSLPNLLGDSRATPDVALN